MDVDSAGRVLIGGRTEIAADESNFFAARYLSSGTLDTSFSSNPPVIAGRSITDVSSGVAPNQDDGAEALKVDANDRPVLGGFAEFTATDDMAVLRLTTSGVRDASFSGDGAAYVDFGANEFGEDLAIDGADRPVIVGLGDTGPAEFAVARFLTDGSPDPTFSGDGNVNSDIGPTPDSARGVAIDRGGRPVVAGASAVGLGADPAVARYEGVPRCAGKIPTLTGTPGKDKLKGTKGKDVISGGDGRDTISGLGKADTICGERGKDRLLGGKGNDRILGGPGADKLIGGKGAQGPPQGRQGQGRPASVVLAGVVAAPLLLDAPFLLQVGKHPVEIVGRLQVHLLAQLGDLDPGVLGDELDGLVGPGAAARAAPAAAARPARAPGAPLAAAEPGDRALDLAELGLQLFAALLQQRTRLVNRVRSLWHKPFLPPELSMSVTSL